MKIIDVTQGSPEWHAMRARCFTASEAPVMMGASSKMRRNELLHMKATGSEKDISEWVQKNLFDKGHDYEAKARVLLEAELGEELYPATATDDEGRLLASLDGLTMMGDINFEHKMWNQALAKAVRDENLPAEYYWQLEHQMLVSGASESIFVVSDGTPENYVSMRYRPVEGRAKQLIAGWAQFEKDLAAYVPTEAKPVVVATVVTDLPAVSAQVTGSIALKSNFDVFEKALRDFIDNRLILDPKTDQDFADLDSQIKALKKAETALDAAEAQMLSQVEAVDQAKRHKDMLSKLTRDNRLMAEKLLEAKKKAVRLEILKKAEDALAGYIDELNRGLGGRIQMPFIAADFTGAMKGKRTVATLQDAADTELARAKIEADQAEELISANVASLNELAAEYKFLFTDAQQLVMKANDDLVSLIKVRIAEHVRLEEEKAEKIRADERARVQREADEKAEQDRLAQLALDEAAQTAQSEEPAAVEVEPVAAQLAQPEAVAESEPVAQVTQPDIVAQAEQTVVADLERATRETMQVEVLDLMALVRAVAEGLAPIDVLQVNQAELNKACAEFGYPLAGTRVTGVKAA